MDVISQYNRWLREADASLLPALRAMTDAEIRDAFYRDLEFGTGGLRGLLGAGTNRMNLHTVGKASQGLADYLRAHEAAPSVVIGYDSRLQSDEFARLAASVLAANGVAVFIWPRLMPVPTVSFAARRLGASAGVVITASHNPAVYNGYKVYGADGCQITTAAAAAILTEIEKLDPFTDVRRGDYDALCAAGAIRPIPDSVYDDFIGAVRAHSVLYGAPADRSAAIVYTPLNGAGRLPVLRALKESGFSNVTVVAEQELPDGHFPTCPFPNPEMPEAMSLGMEYAARCGAALLLATDPDCDRIGVAVRKEDGSLGLLTGNEVGLLLLDYICARRTASGTMPERPLLIKTIVTSELAERIAAHYGVSTVNVLTGFKFIGEQIGFLEQRGELSRYVFGFEESCGYLPGPYVRDKDGVGGAFLICEMFAYYAAQGVTLAERLAALYREYGYCRNTLHSFRFDGAEGFDTMRRIMNALRESRSTLGGKRIERVLDYRDGLDGLPPSDVLRFLLADHCSVVVRPSGTEPKLKIYISVSADSPEDAETVTDLLLRDVTGLFPKN